MDWSIFWNGGLGISGDEVSGGDWTAFGFGVKGQYFFKNKLGIEGRLSYRNWEEARVSVIPFTLGPCYVLSSGPKSTFLLRSGVGVEAILGNDYSGFFLGFDVGPEIQLNLVARGSVIIGVSFAQASVGHPDHFEYLDFSLGWQF